MQSAKLLAKPRRKQGSGFHVSLTINKRSLGRDGISLVFASRSLLHQKDPPWVDAAP